MFLHLALTPLLHQQPWARERLRPHAGKIAELGSGLVSSRVQVTPEGGLSAAPAGAQANLRIHLPARALASLLDGPEALSRQAQVQGDAAFAETVAELLRHLRPDLGAALAPYVGDALAHRAETSGAALIQAGQDTAKRLAGNVHEYISEEMYWTVKQFEAQNLQADLNSLRDDLARLEKRVQKLAL